MNHRIVIFGSSGLTGSFVLRLALENPNSQVLAITRKPLEFTHPRLENITVPELNREHLQGLIRKDDRIFCCLGTTIKKAGSKEVQQHIDRDIPVLIAELSKEAGADCMVTVSAIGSNSSSRNFYLRTKGQMEEGIQAHMGNKAWFLRPSFIDGIRIEKRAGEKIGLFIFRLLEPLIPKRYRAVSAADIAACMLQTAENKPAAAVIPNEQIIGAKNSVAP